MRCRAQRQQGLNGSLGLGVGLGDADALAGGEAVGLDDDRGGAGPEVGDRGRGLVEERGGGGGDPVLQEDLLGVDLRRLEPRAIGLRAVGGDAGGGERVDEAEREGDLGADHDESDFLVLGERDQAGDVIGGDGETRGVLRDAGVAGNTEDPGLGGAREQRADEGMFASAGADDEDRGGEGGHHSTCSFLR